MKEKEVKNELFHSDKNWLHVGIAFLMVVVDTFTSIWGNLYNNYSTMIDIDICGLTNVYS